MWISRNTKPDQNFRLLRSRRCLLASGLLALLDDVAALADDVATLTLAAGRKASGVVADDLAVTAEGTVGLPRDRELPVVAAIAWGSLRNKILVLVPGAALLGTVAPAAVGPLLLWGGAFLALEGAEKLADRLRPASAAGARAPVPEDDRIASAVRTDFVLSAEIVAIALGEVADASPAVRLGALLGVALLATAGVYGLVAALVKLDDAAAWLAGRPGTRALGAALLRAVPWLLRGLGGVGLAAMWLVAGHLVAERIPPLAHLAHDLSGPARLAFELAVGGLVGGLALTARDLALLPLAAALRPAAR